MDNIIIFIEKYWLAIIFAILAGILLWFHKKGHIKLSRLTSKIPASTTETMIKWLKPYTPVIIYILGVMLIHMKCFSLWRAWTDPAWLFVITNVIVAIFAIFHKKVLWLAVLVMALLIILNFDKVSNINTDPAAQQIKEEYPKSCDTSSFVFATMEKPIKAYLDPARTFTLIADLGKAKYVLASNPAIFFICDNKPNATSKKWLEMKAGNYLIYPYESENNHIDFKWWQ